MVARLILVLAIAKLLPVESIGIFGILLASITYGTLVVGMDIYAYSQRKMIGKKINEWGVIIQHQLISHLAGYLILLPFSNFGIDNLNDYCDINLRKKDADPFLSKKQLNTMGGYV